MHARWELSVVLEDHLNGVAHLRPEYRAQGAQVLLFWRTWLELGEMFVSVLAVERLAIGLAYAVFPLAHENVFLLAEGLTGDLVLAAWGVIPVNFVSSYVVRACLRGCLRSIPWRMPLVRGGAARPLLVPRSLSLAAAGRHKQPRPECQADRQDRRYSLHSIPPY